MTTENVQSANGIEVGDAVEVTIGAGQWNESGPERKTVRMILVLHWSPAEARRNGGHQREVVWAFTDGTTASSAMDCVRALRMAALTAG